MTVLEAIRRGAEFLEGKQVESARLQTELLLAHTLRLRRMELYLNFERVLTAEETDKLRSYIKRRGQREPLQHIIGTVCFCGLDLEVDRNVLVPRPETELLAEAGWKFLQSRAQKGENAAAIQRVLDFGTGSGCLAITLAVKCPTARVWAIDISAEALRVAQSNARRLGVSERMEFRNGNGFETLGQETKFALVISNPPYIANGEIETLEPEVKEFDPREALAGGPEGLDFYRLLAAKAGEFLEVGGKILLEFGDGQEESVRKIFEQEMW